MSSCSNTDLESRVRIERDADQPIAYFEIGSDSILLSSGWNTCIGNGVGIYDIPNYNFAIGENLRLIQDSVLYFGNENTTISLHPNGEVKVDGITIKIDTSVYPAMRRCEKTIRKMMEPQNDKSPPAKPKSKSVLTSVILGRPESGEYLTSNQLSNNIAVGYKVTAIRDSSNASVSICKQWYYCDIKGSHVHSDYYKCACHDNKEECMDRVRASPANKPCCYDTQGKSIFDCRLCNL
jgi:hypothetical protein